jgi:hypothetical protein
MEEDLKPEKLYLGSSYAQDWEWKEGLFMVG